MGDVDASQPRMTAYSSQFLTDLNHFRHPYCKNWDENFFCQAVSDEETHIVAQPHTPTAPPSLTENSHLLIRCIFCGRNPLCSLHQSVQN